MRNCIPNESGLFKGLSRHKHTELTQIRIRMVVSNTGDVTTCRSRLRKPFSGPKIQSEVTIIDAM
jgi:hypothetical protein